MKSSTKAPLRFTAIVVASILAGNFARATTATGLGSFEGIEEPLVRYLPGTHAFVPDDFVNITDLGGGVFRMRLRYRPDGWDADRDTPNTDRERAEVKGLGPHQKNGDSFDYETTWRTNPGFQGGSRFCHIFQLKSTDGDSGAPLVTVSISEGTELAAVHYWSGNAKTSTAVREFHWKPGEWLTVRVRIRTSRSADGEVLASINGDEFQGVRGVAVFRPDATDYRPKWGLYRGVTTDMPLGDDYVEHRNVSAEKTGAASTDPAEAKMEIAARELARKSPEKAAAWLLTQPASLARANVLKAVASDWAQQAPVAAMTFAVKLSPADDRAAVMQHVFNRWADRDPDAVLHWATARAPAAELDPLLWYFATDSTLRYVARDKALAGASLINDPELRAQALEHVVLIWARREAEAAALYVKESARLTPTQKTAILEKIHPAKP